MSQARDEFDALMRSKEKRSRHPADDDDDNNNNGHGNNDDARSFLNLSDNDDDEEGGSRTPSTSDPPPRPSLSQSCNVIPLTRYDANTGPKGVIADAQHFRDSRRMHRQSMRSEASLAPPAPSYQHQLLQQQQHSTQHHQRNGRTSLQQAPRGEKQRVESDDEGTQESKDNEDDDNDEDEDDDEDDERDDAFMHQWRTSRLRELQTGSRGGRVHPPASSRRKRMTMYGGLATVDGPGYLSAVDDSPPDTVVVVYIYDDQSSVSTAIEDCLRLLARKHVETRFVRLHYADAEMERAGVPALLAYVGGEKFAGLVPVLLEIPEEAELSAATLEAVMRRHQILR